MTTSYVHATNEEKGHGVPQFEANDEEMDEFVDCVHKELLAGEHLRGTCGRRQPEAQVTIEVAEAAATDEETANGGEQEVQEKHRLKSNEVLNKLQMQTRFLESGPVEVNRATCAERQRSEDLTKRLAERGGCLTVLRMRQKQQEEKGSQQEKGDVVVTAPEVLDLETEQSEKLRELEANLTRLKEQTGSLEERCVTTETKVGESSSWLCQLHTRLEYTVIELSEAKELNAQMDAMKLLLEECEKELRHATARGDSAERELKLREEHMEEADQEKKELEERLRWRNEQFISLEEAYSKLRYQLTEKCNAWDSERSCLFSEIDSLQSTLDLKECTRRETEKQLQMVHHALSREESRRKVLELEAAQGRQGLELATVECDEVQTTLETLRVQSSAEIGFLRSALGAKDRQLNDLQVRNTRTEQEYNHMEEVDREYRASPSNLAEQQEQQSLFMQDGMAFVAEAGDNLRPRMEALEIDHEKKRIALGKALDEAHDLVSAKDEALKHRDSELVRTMGALDHVQDNISCLDIQLKQCETQLEGACEETTTARQELASLGNNIRVEKSLLLESLQGKDIVIRDLKAQIHHMEQMIAELSMHEERHSLMKRNYEELQQRDLQQDARRKALESINNSLLVRASQVEKARFADRKELVAESEASQDRANAVERLLHEARSENERHVGVIRKSEARCGFHVKELVEQCLLAQSSLALSSNEVQVLQAKLLKADTVGAQLRKAEERNRDLEGYLKAAKAIAQDKEEKLAASEWAVQQLALDVGKAKAVVAQKAREEALVRDQLADMERQLRTKEASYLDMECYFQEELKSKVLMQRDADRLRQQMEALDRGAADWIRKEEDLITQLQRVGAILEEKCVALVSCELEIKRGKDLREIMDGAIESLKLQLANEQRSLLAQQIDMNKLFEELERSKGAANYAARLVNDLRGRLEQLKHSCGVRVSQFQSSLAESQDEYSLRRLSDASEQELTNLSLLAEESQKQADEVAWKLAAALSRVAAKNVILKQVNDEILGFRFLIKDVEQETRSLQDGLHIEDHQHSIKSGDLTVGRDCWQQSTSPGKQKAEIQEELNNYLNLCDSLVRKNVRLEKQLDGLQRKNRGLQIQVVELQLTGFSSSDQNRRAFDAMDFTPKIVLQGFSQKTAPRVDKAVVREKTVILQSLCAGKVLGEIDENAAPGILEMCRMSQKPSVSSAAAMQRTNQKA